MNFYPTRSTMPNRVIHGAALCLQFGTQQKKGFDSLFS